MISRTAFYLLLAVRIAVGLGGVIGVMALVLQREWPWWAEEAIFLVMASLGVALAMGPVTYRAYREMEVKGSPRSARKPEPK